MDHADHTLEPLSNTFRLWWLQLRDSVDLVRVRPDALGADHVTEEGHLRLPDGDVCGDSVLVRSSRRAAPLATVSPRALGGAVDDDDVIHDDLSTG